MRILVAHEDARTRGRIAREGRRFRATNIALASSPGDALRLLRSWQPDVVLMSAPMAERCTAERVRPTRRSSMGMPPRDPAGSGRRAGPRGRDMSAVELASVIALLRSDGRDEETRAAVVRRVRDRRGAGTALAPIELEVLTQLARGSTTSQIATALAVPEHIIDGHIAGVLAKLRLRDRDTPQASPRQR